MQTNGRASVTAKYKLILLLGLVVLALDQVSKSLAVAHLSATPQPVFGTFLQLNLVRNPGAAFSSATSLTWLLSLLAIAAVITILVLGLRVKSQGWALAFGVLLGGVLGNLADRIFRSPGVLRGHVVDFLQLPNWPVFNVADILINIAAGIIILQSFKKIQLDGSRGD